MTEKRKIFLIEGIIVVMFSGVMYLIDHAPYVFFTYGLTTIICTNVISEEDLIRVWKIILSYWDTLKAHWYNHEQQQQSLEIIKQQNRQHAQVQFQQQQLQNPQQRQQPPVAPVIYSTHQPPSSSIALQSQPSSSVFYAQNQSPRPPPPTAALFQPLATSSPLQPHSKPFSQLPSSKNIFRRDDTNALHHSPISSQTRPFQRPNVGLVRNPLPSYTKRIKTSSWSSSASSLMTKFLPSLQTHKEVCPPGLKNAGRNLCFMNSIIQSLSHTPGLVQQLSSQLEDVLVCDSSDESIFLSSCFELMHNCSPEKSKRSDTLDPSVFISAGSNLNRNLLAPPGCRQSQQDAAEFLLWILVTLHELITKAASKKGMYYSPSVEALKKVYGDLIYNERCVAACKDECREEIERSSKNKLPCEEAVQRLGDMEWISNKKDNYSVIDDCFSGQLIEGYQNLKNNQTTVSLQKFTVLPIPIVLPRFFSGIVPLYDCFARFCSTENIDTFEQDQVRKTHHPSSSGSFNSFCRKRIPGSFDSGIYASPSHPVMSPIRGGTTKLNDSGFHNNVFKTSTPVPNYVSEQPIQTDVQRNCLFRHLSDCLIVQLLRFRFNPKNGLPEKVHSPVNIPLKGLDLTDLIYDRVIDRLDMTASSEHCVYDLYALCIHVGGESTNEGHYIAYCLGDNGKWFMYDDELVMEVNIDYEINSSKIRENAYILFYKATS